MFLQSLAGRELAVVRNGFHFSYSPTFGRIYTRFMATIPDTILALEKAALDRWGKGDPSGYLELYAPDVSYFDPAVAGRIDGLDAMQQYYAPFTGKISVDRFEYLNPHVKVNGDIAILTYNLISHGRGAEGAPAVRTRWNVTEVYEPLGGDWKIVHSSLLIHRAPVTVRAGSAIATTSSPPAA